jgi:hypothetical protein
MKNINRHFMRTIVIAILCILAALQHSFGQESAQSVNEKIIKNYFRGWVGKDWNAVAGNLAVGFTFTSAAPDDHIPIDKFKEKCWVQAEHIDHFEFPRFISNGNETFAIVHVITKDNRTIRNIEYFTFEKGKIKSIEVFFGGNGEGFPTGGNKQ